MSGQDLDVLFTSDYVQILDQYLVAQPVDKLGAFKSQTELFFKSYGTFL